MQQFFAVYIYEKLCYPHHNERHITEKTKYKIPAAGKIILRKCVQTVDGDGGGYILGIA